MTDIAAEAHVEDPEGLLIDALVLLIADAKARKGANPESTSDVRVTEAEALIRRLTHGWVLAREQDALDGEALRRLREALPKAEYPDGWVIELEDDPEESVRRRLVCITVTDAADADQAFGSGATIAEAADAARGVLEARDA